MLERVALLHSTHHRARFSKPRENGMSREVHGHLDMCHDQPTIVKKDFSKGNKRGTHDVVSG